jgi:hypothetical protein
MHVDALPYPWLHGGHAKDPPGYDAFADVAL